MWLEGSIVLEGFVEEDGLLLLCDGLPLELLLDLKEHIRVIEIVLVWLVNADVRDEDPELVPHVRGDTFQVVGERTLILRIPFLNE